MPLSLPKGTHPRWRSRPRGQLGGAAVLLTSRPAAAHTEDVPLLPQDVWQSWTLDPWLLVLIGFAVALYAVGLRRLWGRAGASRGVKRWQPLCYGAGILFLLIALVSPLDRLAAELSSAHMVQHLLLVAAAAPLLVLAAPLPVYIWALPRSWRRSIGRGAQRPWVAVPWRLLTRPDAAWLLHALALWAWHMPPLYQAALSEPLLHELEHASFFATALLFWWVVFRAAWGVDLALLFTTLAHSGILAALMTFAPAPWYPAYADSTSAWGLTPLEDQQLAGLIMWVPASLVYVAAAIVLLGLWLNRLDRNVPERWRQ